MNSHYKPQNNSRQKSPYRTLVIGLFGSTLPERSRSSRTIAIGRIAVIACSWRTPYRASSRLLGPGGAFARSAPWIESRNRCQPWTTGSEFWCRVPRSGERGCHRADGRPRYTATVSLGLSNLLVLDDGSLSDDAEFVIGGVGDRCTAAPNLDAPIGVLKDVDVLPDESPALCAMGDQIKLPAGRQRQILCHSPQLP